MLTCLVVFNMSGTGREMVRCEYCSQEMRRKNLKEHTENGHGKGMPIKEKEKCRKMIYVKFLADPGKPRGCSTNTSVTNSLIQSFMSCH